MERPLEKVFNPRSVAVIGASEVPGKAAERRTRSLIEGGYGGRIYLINPKRSQIFSRKAYPSILDIDGQDSDKLWCPPVPIQIIVNKKKLFDGPNPFVKQGWSRMQVPLPKGVLRKGENVIEIRNLVASDSLISHWCMISEVLVRFP